MSNSYSVPVLTFLSLDSDGESVTPTIAAIFQQRRHRRTRPRRHADFNRPQPKGTAASGISLPHRDSSKRSKPFGTPVPAPPTQDGYALLHLAALNPDPAMIQYMLQGRERSPVSLDAQTSGDRETALHACRRESQSETRSTAFGLPGANPNLINRQSCHRPLPRGSKVPRNRQSPPPGRSKSQPLGRHPKSPPSWPPHKGAASPPLNCS